MGGAGNDGIIEFYAREAAAHEQGKSSSYGEYGYKFGHGETKGTIRLKVLGNTSTLITITGRTIGIPADRIIYVTEEEVPSLRSFTEDLSHG